MSWPVHDPDRTSGITLGLRRREFILLLGGVAASSLSARAQLPHGVRRIGVLIGYAETDSEVQIHIAAFRDGLGKLGWTEGRNILIDTRWATPGDTESMQRFAKELIALQPDLLVSNTTPATTALLQQTRTIPIVFASLSDPIGNGLVASFPRPGGNVTGFTVSEPTLAAKWLQLLKEMGPHIARVAMLFNPATAQYAEFYLNSFKAAAIPLAVEAILAPVHKASDLDSVFATQAREPNSAVAIGGKPDSNACREHFSP